MRPLATALAPIFAFRLARLRRVVAALVAGVLALGCLEPVVEAVRLEAATTSAATSAATSVARSVASAAWRTRASDQASGRMVSAPGAADTRRGAEIAVTPASGDEGGHDAQRDLHACVCTHAVLALSGAVPVAATMVSGRRLPIGGADCVPPSPTRELPLRPPAPRAV